MRVLFFTAELTEGGAERVISILSNEMVERGFDVSILKYLDSKDFYKFNDKISIDSVVKNTRSNNYLKNLKWMHKYFKLKADVIISFVATSNMLAIAANKGNNIPLIVSDRNDPSRVPSNSLIRKARDIMYKYADRVVVQTEHNKNYFYDGVKEKTVVIKNPIDMSEKVGIALKARKEKTIVSVGRLKKQKNQKLLIEAFNDLKDKYPDYKVIIYGEGDYRSELENLIETLKLIDRVLLPGMINDVADTIASANCFVLPSDYEGMPNALIEAMCIGLPCIATRVSGSDELIQDGENGLLINIGDKKALVDSIDKILGNESLAEKLGEKAKGLSSELTISKIMNQWIKLINEMVESV